MQKKKQPKNTAAFFYPSGYPDSNGGPPAPEAGALSQLRHIPKLSPCGANQMPLVEQTRTPYGMRGQI